MQDKKDVMKSAISKIKLSDIGHKMDYGLGSNKSKTYYPQITVDCKDFPDIEHKNVGDTCKFIIEAMLVGHRAIDNGDKKESKYDLEIHSIGSTHDY